MVIPSTLSNECLISKNGGTYGQISCVKTGTNTVAFTNFAISSAITAGSTISLKLDSQVRNPSDTGTISGFDFKVYHSDGYLIEKTITSLSYKVSGLASIPQIIIASSSTTNSEFPIEY